MTESFDDLTTIVCERRERRLSDMTEALRSVQPSWQPWSDWREAPNVAWAAATHTLYETHEAAQRRDRERFHRALELWDPSLKSRAVDVGFGPVLAVSSRDCDRRDDDRFGSPLYLLSPRAIDRSVAEPDLRVAAAWIQRAGLGRWLGCGPGAVVLLERRDRTAPVRSYSVLALQATVFMEWTASDVRLGESLLHETVHCWLNECLQACNEDLATSAQWYSPWTDTMRPAYGIVHAVLAFSVLCRYWSAVLPLLADDSFDQRYCVKRLEVERANLARVRFDFESALRHVQNSALKYVVAGALEQAASDDRSNRLESRGPRERRP